MTAPGAGSAPEPTGAHGQGTRGATRLAVVIGALGVVFGDIGTSPIYTLSTVFNPSDPHPVPISVDNVFGVVSLIFWSVMIIVTVTYVLLAMRADNDGEGGIMALITLLVRRRSPQRGKRAAVVLAGLGIFGAALFFGDSMITPAISVLSAVEGLKVVQPSLEDLIVPITAVIIVVLFLVQRRATATVGRVFGPVMIAWFVTIGAFGVVGIAGHPAILKALSPAYALNFMGGHFDTAFFALAFAFGMAVTGTITITTLLFFYIARAKWGTPLWLIGVGAAALLLVDLLFLAANMTKLIHGAWLPLLIGLTAFTVMTTWHRGREIVTAAREQREGSLREFIGELRERTSSTQRVPGTAVFLNRGKQTAPLAMRANVEHNHVRHEHVVIVSIDIEPVPRVPVEQRVVVDDLGFADDGITHVSARFGYLDTPDVPRALRTLEPAATEGQLQLDQASYFLSTIELRRGNAPTMATWRKRLFIATSHIAADAAEHFGLPRDRTVIMGSHIEV